MSQHFARKKPTPFLLRFFYLLNKFILLKNKTKLNLYLDMEWIFARLAHETAIKYYSNKNFPTNKTPNAFLQNKININDTVLDLGCNLGDMSFLIAQKAKNVVGIDQNDSAISIAKSKYNLPNLQFLNNEVLSFLTSNKVQFDVLILSHLLEHLDNPQDFLLRFKSFFKLIYIEVPDLEVSILNQHRIDLNSNFQYTDDDHLIEFDRVELIQLIKACDLKIIESEYIYGVQKYWCSVN